MGLHVLAFDDLTKSALTENVEDEVPGSGQCADGAIGKHSLVAFLRAQPIVNIQNIVIVLVIIAFIVNGFAWLCKNSAWIVSRLVSELWIADVIRVDNVGSQLVEGLWAKKKSAARAGSEWRRTER